MVAWVIAAGVAMALIADGVASAQGTGVAGMLQSPTSVALVDSTGKVVARPLSETIVLIAISNEVATPALIRPIYDTDGGMASGIATWKAQGSVLFTAPDCTAGAHIHGLPYAGLRASTQVQTPDGIMLFVGAVGTAQTVTIHSILYDTGCVPVTVRQNGLFAVLTVINLSDVYPPPLAFR